MISNHINLESKNRYSDMNLKLLPNVLITTLTIYLVLASGAYEQPEPVNDKIQTTIIQNEQLAMAYLEDFNIIDGPIMETSTEMLPESAVLEACYEQLGVFILPAGDAEAYLPEGFEIFLPEGFENMAPSGDITPLYVWSIDCKPIQEKEEPLNMVWVDILVVPPETYRSDDVELYTVPVQLFTSSPTLVETLHASGIAQAELSDVTHEVNEPADTVRTGLAHATGGGEEVSMETHVAGGPIPEGGFDARIFGVEDGRVTGVVDVIISDYEIMPGEASLTGNTLFSEQSLESVYSVHAWEIEFHLEPVEHR